MTQFTRVIIDPRHRHARWAMLSLERLHAIVARANDPEWLGAPHALWRLDEGRGGAPSRLYIVSERIPDSRVLFAEFGAGPQSIATCEYEPFLDGHAAGQEWAFRLKANPTRSEPSGVLGCRGKRTGLTKMDDQLEWLYRQARKAGFHMPINRLEMPEVMVRESRKIDFARQDSTVTFVSAVYDGILAVDDPDLLRAALTTGIGRAKGYGFGLLTLVPVSRNLSEAAANGRRV